MISGPKPGDVLLRGSLDCGFYLVDPFTDETIVRDLPSIAAAVEATGGRRAAETWQQRFDVRGRPIGDPFRWSQPFKF